MSGTRRDHLARGDEEVHREIVRQHGDPLGNHLERVHGGEDGRRLPDLPFLAQESVLQVAVAATLPEPRPVTPDGDRAADDEIDGPHLAGRHRTTMAAGAGNARGEQRSLPEPLRIDLDEALLHA